MTVVPLLILPFITMIFWTLGGGKDPNSQDPDSKITKGFNFNLPSAYFSDEKFNKLSLYQKVKKDSIRLIQQRKNDPYFELTPISNFSSSSGTNQYQDHQRLLENSSSLQIKTDPNEELVNKKLEELNQIVNRPPQESSNANITDEPKKDDNQFASEVEKLEQMMIHMGSPEGEQDPELVQLQGMIDQILDIQHPERVRQKIKEQSLQEKKKAFPVHSISEKDLISLIEPTYSPTSIKKDDDSDSLNHKVQDKPLALSTNGFYGLEDEMETEAGASNVIQAVVHETQELVNGSVIKLRLMNDVYIGGHLIPKENPIYGICQIDMERLLISIPSIKHEQSLLPVALTAYDLDGLEGVYVPGIISRDVAKQAADQAVQSFSLDGFDPSLAAQATTAGINAAKALLSRKAKLVKVTVKAGYQVILTDSNS